MSRRIEQIIEEIDEYVESCKYQPLSTTKIVVNKEELEELLRELRLKTPDEIKRYQKIISNKDAILADAQNKADAIIAEAQAKAREMEWLEDFQNYVVELQKSRPKLILCGDYNICHEPIDIHDPVRNATNSGFLPEEREWMTRFLDAGYIDTFRLLNPDKQEYTWWSYRFSARAKNKGWRIDYCMVSEPMKAQVEKAYILNEAVHSDHCPAVIEVS